LSAQIVRQIGQSPVDDAQGLLGLSGLVRCFGLMPEIARIGRIGARRRRSRQKEPRDEESREDEAQERCSSRGLGRATVAVARKLAVLLHHLWVTGEVYAEEFELEEPSTESAGRSPVTGQTADDSQDAPGQ